LECGSDATSYLSGHSPLEKAAARNSCECIRVLIEFGCSIEDTGVGGRPAVISAVAGGALDALDLLIELGADVGRADLVGNTALHVAIELENPVAIIQTLLFQGADKYRRNQAGETPITLSLKSLNMIVIEAIGARGDKIR
jgi:ankyrin repeat protein